MKKVLIPLGIILCVLVVGLMEYAQKNLPVEEQLRIAGNFPADAEITTVQTLEAEDGTTFLWFETDQKGPWLARIAAGSAISITQSALFSRVEGVWQNWETVDGVYGILFLCQNDGVDHVKWRYEDQETWETTPFPEAPSMVFLPTLENGTTEYLLCDGEGRELHE